METIYYFSQKVKLGDTITFNGMNVPVTELLVRENPSMFEVVDDRATPRDVSGNGIHYLSVDDCFTDDNWCVKVNLSKVWVVPSPVNAYKWANELDEFPKYITLDSAYVDNIYWRIFAKKENAEAYIRDNKKDPLFTTVDGDDVYEGDAFYIVDTNRLEFLTRKCTLLPFEAGKHTPIPPVEGRAYFYNPNEANRFINNQTIRRLIDRFKDAPRKAKEGFVYWLWEYFFQGGILQMEIDDFDEIVKKMIDDAFKDD